MKKANTKVPKAGATTKEDKRKARREKLANELNAKKEAQAQAAAQKDAPPAPPVTFGEDFARLLSAIEQDTSGSRAHVDKRAQVQNAIAQMRAIYSDPAFAQNPMAAFDVTNNQLDIQTQMHQQQMQAEAEQKKADKV